MSWKLCWRWKPIKAQSYKNHEECQPIFHLRKNSKVQANEVKNCKILMTIQCLKEQQHSSASLAYKIANKNKLHTVSDWGAPLDSCSAAQTLQPESERCYISSQLEEEEKKWQNKRWHSLIKSIENVSFFWRGGGEKLNTKMRTKYQMNNWVIMQIECVCSKILVLKQTRKGGA